MNDRAQLIVEAVTCKTALTLATTALKQRSAVLEHRIDTLTGMIELAYWLNDPALEHQLEAYRSALRKQLAQEYRAQR